MRYVCGTGDKLLASWTTALKRWQDNPGDTLLAVMQQRGATWHEHKDNCPTCGGSKTSRRGAR
jgi:uncharacterized Fe-S cluster-containing MiaB family protein